MECLVMKPGEFMEINEYMKCRNEYDKSFLANLSHRARLIMHPLLWFLIKCKNKLSGFKIVRINTKIEKTNRPIIFSITHIGKFDIEICAEALKKHFYLLSGDFENVHGTSDGNFIELNGIIYLNKYDKEDKTHSKEKSISILKQGGNIFWFPEGIWNLSPNQPVLPIPFGIIEVALKSNAVIVPVAIEQYDKEFRINVGSNLYVETYLEKYQDERQLKLAAINDLRDTMSTLKYQIWETLPQNERQNIPNDYFDTFVNARLKEWHGFTYADVHAREFLPKGVTEPVEAFAHLKTLKPIRNNAFLFNKKWKGSPE